MPIHSLEALFAPGGRTVERLLANNMDLGVLRTNAVLQQDEWKEMDSNIVRIAEERLTLTKDLIDGGLTHSLGGIGTTIVQWQRESDMTDAAVSMEPDSAGNRDLLDYEVDQVPIPIIHKDFRLGLRQIEASRRMGSNIDSTNSDAAARSVARGMERIVMIGSSLKFGNLPIYGVTTHPDRITGVAAGPWTAIDNIYETVLAMVEAADKKHRYGPFNLYVAAGLHMNLYRYFTDGSGQTAGERLQNIDQVKSVKVSDVLPANTAVLIQMDSGTIDLAVAQALMPVEWDDKGGLVTNYKVLTAMAPRVKPDIEGNLGIVHFTVPAA
ncbi:MAG: bacteriocin family protein [Clostridiales bacterium]|nr:bacteriocin family protein [Clostridiales bacterium]